MKLLRNRVFAAVMMVTLILGAAAGGSCRSLLKISEKVQAVYNTGEDGLGSLPEYMAVCEICADQLVRLGAEYLGEDAEACRETAALLAASESAKQPADRYTANQKLTEAAESLYLQIKTMPEVDDTDLEKAERLHAEIAGNGDRVERLSAQRRDAYNAAAEAFNKGPLREIPGGLLAGLLGVERLEPVY